MIAVIDTGGANLRSVTDALRRLGAACELTSDPVRIRAATRVVLPGVGAAAEAMSRLAAAGLTALLPTLTAPVLGICLGMQLLFEASDEGPALCLGILPGRVTRLAPAAPARVPHMGWNTLTRAPAGSPSAAVALLAGVPEAASFYFVHSFRAPAGAAVVAWTDHGGPVPAVVSHRNYWGVQFHPEKSQAAGARVLENFLTLP